MQNPYIEDALRILNGIPLQQSVPTHLPPPLAPVQTPHIDDTLQLIDQFLDSYRDSVPGFGMAPSAPLSAHASEPVFEARRRCAARLSEIDKRIEELVLARRRMQEVVGSGGDALGDIGGYGGGERVGRGRRRRKGIVGGFYVPTGAPSEVVEGGRIGSRHEGLGREVVGLGLDGLEGGGMDEDGEWSMGWKGYNAMTWSHGG